MVVLACNDVNDNANTDTFGGSTFEAQQRENTSWIWIHLILRNYCVFLEVHAYNIRLLSSSYEQQAPKTDINVNKTSSPSH